MGRSGSAAPRRSCVPDAGRGEEIPDDGEFNGAVDEMGQGVLGVVVADLQLHVRVLLDEPLHRMGDGVGHDGFHHRHSELVRLRPVADLQRLLPQAVDLGGQGQKLLALRGQLNGGGPFSWRKRG